MVQRDQVVVELYRQAWEASRHPWNLLLSFTSLYVFVGVAVIAYLAQTESGDAFPILLFVLSGFALVGILWTLRTDSISERWNRAQLEIQYSLGIPEPANDNTNANDNRSWWAKLRDTGIAFKSSYLLIYSFSFMATGIAGILFLIGILNFNESTPAVGVEPTAAHSSLSRFTAKSSNVSVQIDLSKINCSENLGKEYCDAVRGAAVAENDEISPYLTAITSDGADSQIGDSIVKLGWNGKQGESLLLTLAFTTFVHPGKPLGYKSGEAVLLTQPAWVTIVPELLDFCQQHDPIKTDLRTRLHQLLGLPPGGGLRSLVEIWVNPEDLFRPSIDPEISDHEAEILLPQSSRFLAIDPAHIAWFNDWFEENYANDPPFPWTRLGYTYDWGNPVSPIGLSEFVIKKGATIGIGRILTPDVYCDPVSRNGS